MLGIWIVTGIVSVVTLGLGAFVYTKKRGTIRASAGRVLKRKRRNRVRFAVRETGRAVKGRRTRRAKTARGIARAARRKRDPRLTFGHVRTEQDPTRTRRAARWAGTKVKDGSRSAVDRYRVRRENRKAAKTGTGPKRVLALGPAPTKWGSSLTPAERAEYRKNGEYLRSHGYCHAKCKDGSDCMNKACIGSDRCQVHGGRRAA